jgi:hypothetical protein
MVRTMKLTQLFEYGDRQVLIIIGDGTFEEKLLRALAPKFNGMKYSLALSLTPVGKRTGLAALQGLVLTLDKGYKVTKALFIVDKEHVTGFDDIKGKLEEHGFKIEGCKRLGNKAELLRLSRGSSEVDLYVVIAGCTKNIEEEVMKLAGKVYGKKIERPEDIGGIKALIEEADVPTIKETLEGIASALQDIERQKSDARANHPKPRATTRYM